MVNVPSFFRAYGDEDTYASKKGYPPSALGMVRIGIIPFRGTRVKDVESDLLMSSVDYPDYKVLD